MYQYIYFWIQTSVNTLNQNRSIISISRSMKNKSDKGSAEVPKENPCRAEGTDTRLLAGRIHETDPKTDQTNRAELGQTKFGRPEAESCQDQVIRNTEQC